MGRRVKEHYSSIGLVFGEIRFAIAAGIQTFNSSIVVNARCVNFKRQLSRINSLPLQGWVQLLWQPVRRNIYCSLVHLKNELHAMGQKVVGRRDINWRALWDNTTETGNGTEILRLEEHRKTKSKWGM